MATPRQFELFVATARQLNITRTSQLLHTSQSSISQQLIDFQREFGAVFLRPTSRGVELTPQGREALLKAEAIVAGIESFKKTFGPTSAVTVERLVLGASHGPATSIFPRLMTRFRERFPNVELDLRTSTGLNIEELILQGNLDIAVIANPPPNPALEMEYFRKEVLSVFVAANHPLARKKSISAAEFSTLPLVIRGGRNSRNRTEELLNQFRNQGFAAKVRMRMESPDSIKAAVRGEGVAGILYRDLLYAGVDSGHYKILNIPGLELTGQSYIVQSKAKPLTEAGQAFLAELRRVKTTFHRPGKSPRMKRLTVGQLAALF